LRYSDADVMQRVQGGDFASFDLLVCRYRGPLLQAAWSKLGNRAWAEDVVQEAFLAAFAARHTYDPTFSFRTWLWTILLNLCRRQWKRRESRPQEISWGAGSDDESTSLPEPATETTALTQMLAVERRQQVHVLLARLPEPQADALRLRFFGGLQFDEIAEIMGSSVSGAKRRVKTGLEALARLMREQDGELG